LIENVLDGEITIHVDDERIVATAGMFANMPVGSLHSIRNETDRTARMLISVAPAGLEQMSPSIRRRLPCCLSAFCTPAQDSHPMLLSNGPFHRPASATLKERRFK
jgi:Cupin domain